MITESKSQRQVDCLIRFLRKYVPGFENCYLDRTAAQVGIRETRRIIGDYILTAEEVISARHFAVKKHCMPREIPVSKLCSTLRNAGMSL